MDNAFATARKDWQENDNIIFYEKKLYIMHSYETYLVISVTTCVNSTFEKNNILDTNI